MVTRRKLKEDAKEQLSGQWGTVIGALLTQMGIVWILNQASANSNGGLKGTILSLANILVISILGITMTNFFYKISKWNRVKYRDMFANGHILGKGICVNLMSCLLYIPVIIVECIILMIAFYKAIIYPIMIYYDFNYLIGAVGYKIIWSIIGCLVIFIIPIMILGVYFSFAILCVCEDSSRGTWECIKLSFKTMHGNFWRYIVLQLSFILWGLLIFGLGVVAFILFYFPVLWVGGVLFSIGAIACTVYVSAYIQVTNINFYNEIISRKDEDSIGFEEY